MKLVTCAVLLAACGGSLKEPDSLGESIRSFNEGIRWERFAVAAVRVPARERSQFVEDMDERATDLKITDYEIVRVDQRGANAARVHLKLSWYRTSEGTLRETHAMQSWERQGKTWMMVDATRMRGAEMPGLVDPPSASPVGDAARSGGAAAFDRSSADGPFEANQGQTRAP